MIKFRLDIETSGQQEYDDQTMNDVLHLDMGDDGDVAAVKLSVTGIDGIKYNRKQQ